MGKKLTKALGSNHAAYHIIMTGTQDAQMNISSTNPDRRYKPDSKANGIWLPQRDSDKISKRANISHQQDSLHGRTYRSEIYYRLTF